MMYNQMTANGEKKKVSRKWSWKKAGNGSKNESDLSGATVPPMYVFYIYRCINGNGKIIGHQYDGDVPCRISRLMKSALLYELCMLL